jgi:uncharacterized membrane protein YeaQ/YmgE (transglycosylase-associated protein family)
MGFITWIIFGLIAGAIAKMIMPGTQGADGYYNYFGIVGAL